MLQLHELNGKCIYNRWIAGIIAVFMRYNYNVTDRAGKRLFRFNTYADFLIAFKHLIAF